MTAVVGILNKHAIALAADSAVTINGENNRKIFNRANKIFTLSKYHPIGVMMYNSASFMTTPWETIIKVYRKQLNNKPLPTVNAYVEDFIQFLHNHHYFTDEQTQKNFLFGFLLFVINAIRIESLKNHRNLMENPIPENQLQISELIDQKSDEIIAQFQNNQDICPEFIDYTLDSFREFTDDIFEKAIMQLFTNIGIILPAELLNKIRIIAHQYLRMKEENTAFTGLIFVGFGDEEIYPHLIPVDISIVVQDRLRYFIDSRQEAHISNETSGAIRPFAQTDVIDTILTGVDPKLETAYFENFKRLFSEYNQEILRILGNADPELTAQIQGLDINSLTTEYESKNEEIKRSNYITPLMNAVSSLSKEDLSEMAESLIYLTYLKRRFTFAEESVGGPVDVALISKGDGFIWIKRKHYFSPELNQNFINNYLNT